MTNLNEVFGLNKYCGPAVLSALTGKSTDTCAAVLSNISGKNVIRAVGIHHLLDATKLLGFIPEEVKVYSNTVYGLLSSLSVTAVKNTYYIILVPHHVIAIHIGEDRKIYLIDNHTKKPINASSSARLTQKVEKVWQVKPKPQPSQKDLVRGRINWLRSQIDIANRYIADKVRHREEYIKELEQLENEDANRSSN